MNSHDITSWFASMALKRKMSPFVERYLGRPFSKKSAQHVLIGYYPLDISWAQIYPFLHYAPQLLDIYNVEIRCVPVGHILEGQPLPCGAPDVLLFQPWFTTDENSLAQRLEDILQRHPQVKISFVDSFAHTDIRLADSVDPYIEFYLKKSLFKDRNNYLRSYRGDTNLTEYYGDLFQLDQPMVNWNTPETILPKLRLSPNFHLAPKFLRPIAKGYTPPKQARPLDMQTRLGKKGSEWYSAMRQHAIEAMGKIGNISTSPENTISYKEYMAELSASKICFSPFGYGELCWRDIEAIFAGAVLVKPDMSHLETLPDLYEDNVTYKSVRWDFADLPDVVHNLLQNPEEASHIADQAFQRMSSYICSHQFVSDMSFLFDSPSSS